MDHDIAIIDNAIPDIRSPVLVFCFKSNCPMFSFVYAINEDSCLDCIVKQFFNINETTSGTN